MIQRERRRNRRAVHREAVDGQAKGVQSDKAEEAVVACSITVYKYPSKAVKIIFIKET
jgi:hypothetical protein